MNDDESVTAEQEEELQNKELKPSRRIKSANEEKEEKKD